MMSDLRLWGMILMQYNPSAEHDPAQDDTLAGLIVALGRNSNPISEERVAKMLGGFVSKRRYGVYGRKRKYIILPESSFTQKKRGEKKIRLIRDQLGIKLWPGDSEAIFYLSSLPIISLD